MAKPISKCRICGNDKLVTVLDLGEQALTGVFPKNHDDPISVGPLQLLLCQGKNVCGLLQLAHSYDADEMYGANYGYRSGLNPSMVAHLRSKVDRIKSYGLLRSGDIVLDIGANDGTSLHQYERPDCRLVGMDPTSAKFSQYYSENVRLIADFFTAANFHAAFGDEEAKVVTSFSMFYDLEDPTGFMREVHSILADDGIWVLEQSYMPLMLETNSYDTVCHEHLEYYAMAQINWMARAVGFEVVDVELNDVNGGSFSVVLQKQGGPLAVSASVVDMNHREEAMRLDDLETYAAFAGRVEASRQSLIAFLHSAKAQGKRVVGLGASTKGNVLLQYCGIDASLIDSIGEVNPDKFGAFTPGMLIPIRDERELLAEKPDYCLVLPWHFRRFFESNARYKNVNLVFPLPVLKVAG
jgi:NDP-4-keto-2,6-dideoxyhexose 3-C-methyltransferase